MDKKKNKGSLLLLFVIIIIILLCIWGLNQCIEKFWEVSFYEILSLAITSILTIIGVEITYKLTKKDTDIYRRYDKIDNEIIDIIIYLQDDFLRLKNYTASKSDVEILLSKITKLDNRISFLKNYCNEKEFEEEFSLIKLEFIKFSAVQDYKENKNLVMKNRNKLNKRLDDIEQYLRKIRIKIINLNNNSKNDN